MTYPRAVSNCLLRGFITIEYIWEMRNKVKFQGFYWNVHHCVKGLCNRIHSYLSNPIFWHGPPASYSHLCSNESQLQKFQMEASTRCFVDGSYKFESLPSGWSCKELDGALLLKKPNLKASLLSWSRSSR